MMLRYSYVGRRAGRAACHQWFVIKEVITTFRLAMRLFVACDLCLSCATGVPADPDTDPSCCADGTLAAIYMVGFRFQYPDFAGRLFLATGMVVD